MREVRLFHFPDAEPERWQVEEYEADGDAGVAVAIFTGPHAERRARELADRLRGAEQQKKAARIAPDGHYGNPSCDSYAVKPHHQKENRMAQAITEDMGVHKEWYVEARDMTPERLPAFIAKLTQDYQHDYGTICHAASAAAVAAAWAVDKSPQGGIIGVPARAVMWGFISHWMSYEGQPLRLVNYREMLYPQNAHKFDRVISKKTHSYLVEEAKKMLAESDPAHPNVVAHWNGIVAGAVPFGYRVTDES